MFAVIGSSTQPYCASGWSLTLTHVILLGGILARPSIKRSWLHVIIWRSHPVKNVRITQLRDYSILIGSVHSNGFHSLIQEQLARCVWGRGLTHEWTYRTFSLKAIHVIISWPFTSDWNTLSAVCSRILRNPSPVKFHCFIRHGSPDRAWQCCDRKRERNWNWPKN